MKEDFLHHIWQYKKFDFSNLKTVCGKPIVLYSVGNYLEKAGPDFFNAQLEIDEQKWAGNVEIHLKSSDWYVHHHETDENYNNVILHVVWHHDTDVYRKNNQEIPVLELKNYVSKDILDQYLKLMQPKSWIFCENQIKNIDDFILKNWQERLFMERLESKAININELLNTTENDWEAVLYFLLAKNFGLNTNGATFQKMAQSIPFSTIRKEKNSVQNLEALFFGRLEMLDATFEDTYANELKQQWEYLSKKHQLEKVYLDKVQYFKHRPDNFPTIRLAQLAQLFSQKENLFHQIITASTLSELYQLFALEVSSYWQIHYQFDKVSSKKKKNLSSSFIDLIIINTIIPLKFVYFQSIGKDNNEELIELMSEIKAEKNTIIEKFSIFGITSKNAFDSQSLIELKNNYCVLKKCMDCAVGQKLLR